MTRYNEFKLYYLKKDRAIGGLISKSGAYERFEIKTLLNQLGDGDVAIDIGANIGAYTLPMSRSVGLSGKVYAFEPEANNRNFLVQNLTANYVVNTIVSPMALSDRQGEMNLYLSKTNLGDHRLFPEENKKRREVTIKADMLDHQMQFVFDEKRPVKLIKSDTQGYEPFVIDGARKTIKRNRPAIFLEYWPWGFARSGANAQQMLDFLLPLYGKMFYIDEKHEKLISVDREFIERYCQAHQGYMHCNLAFLP